MIQLFGILVLILIINLISLITTGKTAGEWLFGETN